MLVYMCSLLYVLNASVKFTEETQPKNGIHVEKYQVADLSPYIETSVVTV